MSDLIPFAFDSHAVRALMRAGEPWFVVSDICAALGIADTGVAVRKLDEDEKGAWSIRTPGGQQEMLIVSESGLYTLALRSREATTPGTPAHRFRKWVTAEVLPSLRRTGRYGSASTTAPTVPADHYAASQAELIELQRKLIATQERLLVATGKTRKRNPPKPLTSDEIAEIRRLRASGLPCAEVARRVGRSSGTVSMMTRNLPGGAA